MDFSGEIEFTNNSANGEGVLSLLSFGQMRLQRGTYFRFTGNLGRYYCALHVAIVAEMYMNSKLNTERCRAYLGQHQVPILK